MQNDEKRSHRLNSLLQYKLKHGANTAVLFNRAKAMGVSDTTARDYVKTVNAQHDKIKRKRV